MFTRSCSEVKLAHLAAQQTNGDLLFDKQDDSRAAVRASQGEKQMFGKALQFGRRRLVAENENLPEAAARIDTGVSASNVRALATGAALAVSLDTSPAVLVSIYDYAHRYRDKGRRSA
jgi:hypothetical protein